MYHTNITNTTPKPKPKPIRIISINHWLALAPLSRTVRFNHSAFNEKVTASASSGSNHCAYIVYQVHTYGHILLLWHSEQMVNELSILSLSYLLRST